MENAGKLRLLYIARILIKQTNDEHMLSTSQIIDILKNEYGISAHRITVTSDIETLQAAGMDICKIESTQNKYFLAQKKGRILPATPFMIWVTPWFFMPASSGRQDP